MEKSGNPLVNRTMPAYAHTKTRPDGSPAPESEWEPLERHLQEVAKLAGEFADAFGATEWGYLAGLWHDLGKYWREEGQP